MTPTETATILRQYREWLCDTPKSVRPLTRQINEAIDAAVEMIDRLEAAEKETASWKGLAKQFGNEADALRAKVDAMEQQEPVAWISSGGDVARSKAFMDEMGFACAPLYLAPGAKGEDE